MSFRFEARDRDGGRHKEAGDNRRWNFRKAAALRQDIRDAERQLRSVTASGSVLDDFDAPPAATPTARPTMRP